MAVRPSSLNGPRHLLFLVHRVLVSWQAGEFCQVLFLPQVRWSCRFFPFIPWTWCVLSTGFCRLNFLCIPCINRTGQVGHPFIHHWSRFTPVAFCWGLGICVHQPRWSPVKPSNPGLFFGYWQSPCLFQICLDFLVFHGTVWGRWWFSRNLSVAPVLPIRWHRVVDSSLSSFLFL